MTRAARALILVLGWTAVAAGQAPPKAPIRPVTDEYFGVKVVDPYRWLDNWDDPDVRAWAEAQTKFARAQLDAQPFVEAVRQRVNDVGGSSGSRWTSLTWRPDALFAIKFQPPLNQPLLVVMPTSATPTNERVILDLNRLDSTGATTVDFFVPSHDGRRVAVSLSVGGTEEGTIHFFDVADGKESPDSIPRVNGGTAGGSVAWTADGSGVFYTRYPRGNERPAEDRDFYQQVYFHKLGTPAESDTYELGRELPRIAEIQLESSPDGSFVLAAVRNGDGGEVGHYLRRPSSEWRRIAAFEDGVSTVTFGKDTTLYALSHKDAPHGRIVTLDTNTATVDAGRTIYRATDGNISEFAVTTTQIVVDQVVGGPDELRIMDLDGGRARQIPLPSISSVFELVAVGDDALFQMQSYVQPPAWHRLRRDGGVIDTPLAVRSSVDYSDIVVKRAEATSKDGTKVPMTIMHRKNVRLDGSNPTLLYGYGGYGSNESPGYSPTRIVWLEQGGVYATANIRGGAEFGEPWHEAGKLTKKQNVFDDFVACAKRLVSLGYTTPAKLAIQGGSNGGLLMGAVLTQNPSIARAVVSSVGVYDMMRFELWPNGQFNTTEFGSVKDPVQFESLFSYSPYHHVTPGTAYPAVLMLSGTNDPRVNPGDSRRFAARLQAATSSARPILLRVAGVGHIGSSLSEGLAQRADIYTFLFWQLGVKYRPIVSTRSGA